MSFKCTKACFVFRITQKISDILRAIIWNRWKCIFNCVTCFLTLSNKVEKCLCIRFVYLSVCPYVCTCSNSCKYSSNVVKFIYDVHNWYRMNYSENSTHGAKVSFTETHKYFSDTLRPIKGNFSNLFQHIALNVMKLTYVI